MAPRARDVALQVLLRVERGGAYAAAALAAEGTRLTDPRDSALAYELVYGVLRQRPWLDHLLDGAAIRGLEKIPSDIRNVLRMGAYQIAFMERIRISAAVNESVSLAKRSRSPGLAALVNALLRTLSRQPAADLKPPPPREDIAPDQRARASGMPEWLFSRFADHWGEKRAVLLAGAFNRPSRRTLRINVNRLPREKALEKLTDTAHPGALTPWSVHVSHPEAAKELVSSGLGAYQDEAAQLAVLALTPSPGERILDACAGRGGKTAAIAMVKGDSDANLLTASDRSRSKLERLSFELGRQGFSCRTVPWDITEETPEPPPNIGGPFDAVLLDAPCSGTGTIGRRPEIRWRLDETAIPSLVAVQEKMLDRVAPLVAGGGRLLFVVCSLLSEEGKGHLDRFLARHRNFVQTGKTPANWPDSVPWNSGSVTIDPIVTSTDGYQMLCLTRRG